MRVLHYVDVLRLDQGGVVRAVLDLTAELARAGAEVTLLTGDATDAHAEWLKNTKPPRVVTLDRTLAPLFRTRKATQTKIKKLVADADMVHLHTPWDPVHLAIAKAARRSGTPYGVSLHGMLDDWCLGLKAYKKHLYLAAAGRRLLRGAAWLHCTASIEADQSLRHVPGGTSLVEPLIIDAAPYRSLLGPQLAREAFPEAFQGTAPRLLFLGRLHPIKGLSTLLDAAAGLEGHQPHFLFAGPPAPGHDTELRQQAEQLGMADRVHLLGMVQGEIKQSLYQAADAFVLPSHHENFGIALVEAMMCGSPVLTSKSVNIWPEVEKLGGLIVEHSVTGFKSGLTQLLDELPARGKQATEQREAVFDWLEPQRLAKRYLDAYSQAIQSRNQSR